MANLKLNILYYNTPSDFEMEFNLNGCCRMRIFKDKVETPKEFVSTLAKDIDRSKITIIVTDLKGENSCLELASNALGIDMVFPDKVEYGIKDEDELYILSGGVPLVNKDGIYGGFIIESGAQSIVFITSDRAVRHEVMKAYVHNYVFDIAQIIAYSERMGKDFSDLPTITYGTAGAKETIVKEEPVETDIEEVLNAEEVIEVSDVLPTTEDEYLDVKKEEFKAEDSCEDSDDADSESYQEETSTELPTVEKPQQNVAKNGLSITLLVLVILLLISFGILAYFFVYLPLIGEEGSFFVNENFITHFLKDWFAQ